MKLNPEFRTWRGRLMNEGALQLWHGVLFRQRSDGTLESINPHVQEWTGLEPRLALSAIHPADRGKAELDCAKFRLRHARTWQITWVEQRRRTIPGGYEGYWENVTERVHLTQELAQTHWKATFGMATQRLVHDFNNLMTGILSLSDAYLLRMNADNPAREGLQLINQNARQAADIVQHIGALFRDTAGRHSHENLAYLVVAAADVLRRVLPKYSTLKVNCTHETIPVYVDAVELRKVIVALGLALTPPINVEAGLGENRAYLTIRGTAAMASPVQLMVEAFAERNNARFETEKNCYKIGFPVSDYAEAERQQHSILLISDHDNSGAFRITELLRRNGYEVVIGQEHLLQSGDYRFDAAAAPQEASGSLLRPADILFKMEVGEKEMLTMVGDFFARRR